MCSIFQQNKQPSEKCHFCERTSFIVRIKTIDSFMICSGCHNQLNLYYKKLYKVVLINVTQMARNDLKITLKQFTFFAQNMNFLPKMRISKKPPCKHKFSKSNFQTWNSIWTDWTQRIIHSFKLALISSKVRRDALKILCTLMKVVNWPKSQKYVRNVGSGQWFWNWNLDRAVF